MPIAVRKSLKEKGQLIRLRLPAVSFEAVVDTAQHAEDSSLLPSTQDVFAHVCFNLW